jgi:dihydroorotate dehydrogenase
VIATNTLARFDAAGKPVGGLSGRPLRGPARERVRAVRRQVGDGALVVGVGGIDDAPSARAMLDAGADLIQLYTGLVYEGPFLAAKLARAVR